MEAPHSSDENKSSNSPHQPEAKPVSPMHPVSDDDRQEMQPASPSSGPAQSGGTNLQKEFGALSLNLPQRNVGKHVEKFKNINVLTNHYKVQVDPRLERIHIFAVRFEPMIPHDNTRKRMQVWKALKSQLLKDIPKHVFTGTNLYSPEAGAYSDRLEKTYQAEGYSMKVKKVKEHIIKDNPKMLLLFLNNGLKNIMRRLGYMEIGKSRKYFNRTDKETIESSLTLYSGYKTCFSYLQGGHYLKVEAAKKVVRNETALDVIQKVFKQHQDKPREERREIVKDSLVGTTLMANYGNTNYYRISDVVFGETPESYQFEETNIKKYYQEKYSIKIKDERQPLLKAEGRRKGDDKPCILVPELMLMTGIPDDFDEMRRKKVSEKTIKPADKKKEEISRLVDKMQETAEQKSLKELGVEVKSKMANIKAHKIPNPQLQLGKSDKIQEGKEANFNLFDKPIFQAKHGIKLAIIRNDRFQPTTFEETFKSTTEKLQVNYEARHFPINSKLTKENITTNMEKAIEKQCNICLIIIPGFMKNDYKFIKQNAVKLRMVTQVVHEQKANSKAARTIATKVLLQMIAKRGNTLWVAKGLSTLKDTMLAGFDCAKNDLAMCATINSTFTSIYGTSVRLNQTADKYNKMLELTMEGIKAYQSRNERHPKEVVFFMETAPADQIRMHQEFFLEPLRFQLEKVANGNPPKLTCVMVNTKTDERFFSDNNGRICNPNPGTLITSEVVGPNFDFYLISQASNRGTAVPNHYQVIYSDSKDVQQGELAQLCFDQCFNYVNWTGSIKVPSVLQYARKNAKFVNEVLENKPVPDDMKRTVHYV